MFDGTLVKLIKFPAEHLTIFHGTLVFRGTPVENHCPSISHSWLPSRSATALDGLRNLAPRLTVFPFRLAWRAVKTTVQCNFELVIFRLSSYTNQILLTESEYFWSPKRPKIWAVDFTPIGTVFDDQSPLKFDACWICDNNVCPDWLPSVSVAVGTTALWCTEFVGVRFRRMFVRRAFL